MLFLAVYRLNPDYVMVLFTDPMGQKMLAGAVVHAGPRGARDPQNRQYQGVSAMIASAQSARFRKLVPFAMFGLFAVGGVVGAGAARPRASRGPRNGSTSCSNPRQRRRGEAGSPVKKSDAMTKVLEKASPMAKPLQPKSEAEAGKLKRRLSRRRLPRRERPAASSWA